MVRRWRQQGDVDAWRLATGPVPALLGSVLLCHAPRSESEPGRSRPLQVAAAAVRRIAALLLVGAAVALRADIMLAIPDGLPTGKTVTAEQLWHEFDSVLPAGVWVSPLENTEYEVISAKWLRREFLPVLKNQMKELRRRGIPMENSAANCSGFALVCRLMLGVAAMEARARAPATATVIVKQEQPFGGLSATLENHCVAFVLTDEGPWIIEVQSGEHTALSRYPNLGTVKLVSVH